FQKGELDVMFVLDPDVISDIRDAGVAYHSSLNAANGSLLLNSGRGADPVMADVRLRKAVAHALDPQLLVDRVYNGKGRPNSGITDPEMRIYTGMQGPEYDPEE